MRLFVDADGMPISACSSPVNGDERKHVGKLLETVAVKTRKVRRLAADKGYDADALRNFLKKKGIQPQIPRKRTARTANAHQCATILS